MLRTSIIVLGLVTIFVVSLYRGAVPWSGPGLRVVGHYAWLERHDDRERSLRLDARAGADLVLFGEPLAPGGVLARLDGLDTVRVAPGNASVLLQGLRDFGTRDGRAFATPLQIGDHVVRMHKTEHAIHVGLAAQLSVSKRDTESVFAAFVPLDGTTVPYGSELVFQGCPDQSVRVSAAGSKPPGCAELLPTGATQLRDAILRRCASLTTADATYDVSWTESWTFARVGGQADALRIGLPGAVMPVGESAALIWQSGVARAFEPTGLSKFVYPPLQQPVLVALGAETADRCQVEGPLGAAPRSWARSLVAAPKTEAVLDAIPLESKGDLIQLGRSVFTTLRIRGSDGNEDVVLVRLYRRPAPSTAKRLWFASSRDPSVYVPHPAVSVPRCGEPTTLNITASSGAGGPTSIDDGSARVLALPRPSWLTTPEDAGVSICFKGGGEYEIQPVAPQGSLRGILTGIARMDFDRRPDQPPPSGGSTAKTGQALMVAGQILELLPARAPRAFTILRLSATLAILAAALPLLLLLFDRQLLEDWRRTGEASDGALPSLLRRFALIGPVIVATGIVINMIVGVLFQIRLGASSSLVGTPSYVTHFVVAQIVALATAALLVGRIRERDGHRDPWEKWLWSARSLTLGFAVVVWVDRLLMFFIVESDRVRGPAIAPPWWTWVLPVLPFTGLFVAQTTVAALQTFRRHAAPSASSAPVGRYRRFLTFLDDWMASSDARSCVTIQGPLVALSRARASIVNVAANFLWAALEVVPIFAALSLLELFFVRLPVAPRAKECIGPLIAYFSVRSFWAVAPAVDGRGEAQAEESAAIGQVARVLGTGLFLGAFAWALARVPALGSGGEFWWIAWGCAILIGIAILWPSIYAGTVLLRVFLAYLALLGALELGVGELGELMVWAPVLVTGFVFVALTHVYLPSRTTSWKAAAGHFTAAGLTMALPVVALWILYRFIDVLPAWSALDRARTRFSLVRAPFYDDAGDWLTSVRWLASGAFGNEDHWLANLNSDVAFYGLMHHHRLGAVLVTVALVTVILTLAFGVIAAVRAAYEALDDDERAPLLEAASYATVGLAALVMQVFVHLATGALDKVPVTGVAQPWLSHGGSTGVVFTCVAVAAAFQLRARLFERPAGSA